MWDDEERTADEIEAATLAKVFDVMQKEIDDDEYYGNRSYANRTREIMRLIKDVLDYT